MSTSAQTHSAKSHVSKNNASNQISELASLFEQACHKLQAEGVLPADWQNKSQITRAKDPAHGDYASNIALVSAKLAKTNPRNLAEQIINALPENDLIAKIDIAGAGFINVFLNADAKFSVLADILAEKGNFGLSKEFQGQSVQVEFVSANPTSSLHVGHGRGAAFGMSVANLLEAVGYKVCREYYVNDAGRQMDILATSTYLRYLQLFDEQLVFPTNAYKGDYVIDYAKALKAEYADKYVFDLAEVYADVPADAVYETDSDGKQVLISGDKEKHIDGLIANSKKLLGDDGYQVFLDKALNTILADIKEDLGEFGVHYENWFSEKSVEDEIEPALKVLEDKGYLYEKDGNIWFKSTDFGDEKDRVVRRANGQTTYFASDIAYHKNKYDRGFNKLINVWGADHHGYITRVKSALTALGYKDNLDVILVQFVALWRGEEKVAMSSRSGEFVTLRELREEVGNDAARFYYVSRKPDVHMDFDLELAKSQSKDNAVYYIQYGHARICSVLEKLEERGFSFDEEVGKANQALLTKEVESELLKLLTAYPATLKRSAVSYEPHILTNYLKELVSLFHSWYNDNRILPKDEQPSDEELKLMQARLRMSQAIRQVLANGLSLLGLSAPTSM